MDLRSTRLQPPHADEALVRMLFSGVSRGTERLVFEGRVPDSEREQMRAPMQEGDFPFPVKYGYCGVGVVEKGPALLEGQIVFVLHPHQDRFVAPLRFLARVPEGVPARRAILAANMETALNAMWDCGAGPADRIAIVGAGVIGLLVAFLCAKLPGAKVIVVDPDERRAPIVAAFGAQMADRENPPADMDLVVHTSASAPGLASALSMAGLEATILELSWYGSGEVGVPLGGAFHSRRLRLLSSQVGQVAASRRPRWSHARRLAAALDLLRDDRLDLLLGPDVHFRDLPDALPGLLARDAAGLCPVVRY